MKSERENIEFMGKDPHLRKMSVHFLRDTAKYKYTYHFSWLGRPIIQTPQDIIAVQEIIWQVRPDLVIETGIAHGGSLVLTASILELLGGAREVVGIDIEIRPHNRKAIEEHSVAHRIRMLEGSSTDEDVARQIHEIARDKATVLVILDSMHTHDHVLHELQLYSPLVNKGSYMVVMDTAIEDMPDEFCQDRPWGKGDNPKTAVWEFLKTNDRFEIDKEIENKLLITVAPDGYLKCIKN